MSAEEIKKKQSRRSKDRTKFHRKLEHQMRSKYNTYLTVDSTHIILGAGCKKLNINSSENREYRR